jgi:recombination protein U
VTIHYPNGRQFVPKSSQPISSKPSSPGNRGMSLEHELDLANQFYLATGLANIHKKPTPIQIVNVAYPQRSAAKITEAYFRQASTTDYNGIYRGHYLDFDAKETKAKTNFPLSNVHEHQINHLRDIIKHAGWAFFIIRFTQLDETYVVPASLLIQYWDQQASSRKSIPYTVITEVGQKVPLGINPSLPYLKAIDQLMDDI